MDIQEQWYCELIDTFQLTVTLCKINTLDDFRACLESFIVEHGINDEPLLCKELLKIGEIKFNVKDIYETK